MRSPLFMIAATHLGGWRMSEWRKWSQCRIDRMLALWRAGHSASEIAIELGGVTRSAVLGKIHRLSRQSPAIAMRQSSRAIASTFRLRVNVPPQRQSLNRQSGVLAPLGAEVGVGGLCKYIDGPRGSPMCGRPEHKRGFCAAHYALCYSLSSAEKRDIDKTAKRTAEWIAYRESAGIKRGVADLP